MSEQTIVDDTDTSIIYTSGPWSTDLGALDDQGGQGSPFHHSLHGTSSNASFSYAFNGAIRNLECLVDNISTSSTVVNTMPSDGLHTLTVNVSVSAGQTGVFWFDYFRYTPSATMLLDQATIRVDPSDPQLEYGQGWQSMASGPVTADANSTFTFPFIGTSLVWYGYIPNDNSFGLAATAATFAIDSQLPTTFNLAGLPSHTSPTQFNQIFFQSAELPNTQHTLEVVYQGNSQTTPLTLQYLVVQNGTSPPITTSLTNSLTTSLPSPSSVTNVSTTALPSLPSPTGAERPGSSDRIAATLGGVLGGLALIALAISGLLYARRRKSCLEVMAYLETPKPFGHSPEASAHLQYFPQPISQANTDLSGTGSRSGGGTAFRNEKGPRPSIVTSTNSTQSTAPASPPVYPRPQLHNYHASPIFIRDEDINVRVSDTDHGSVILLPPVYSSIPQNE
ncbi:hypothetical protein BDZ97DRAFT_1915115 [Flammula alnicola]|nr:hypothetical protein BDZ97DRAFT_1915115 [Flammula alnicola]